MNSASSTQLFNTTPQTTKKSIPKLIKTQLNKHDSPQWLTFTKKSKGIKPHIGTRLVKQNPSIN